MGEEPTQSVRLEHDPMQHMSPEAREWLAANIRERKGPRPEFTVERPMTPALSREERAAMRADHSDTYPDPGHSTAVCCAMCDEWPPCKTIRLLDALDAAEAEARTEFDIATGYMAERDALAARHTALREAVEAIRVHAGAQWLIDMLDRALAADGAGDVEHVIAAALAALADTDGLVKVLRGVLSEHVIECTGCGEVSCRACRDQGWMSWQDYHWHLATHLAAAVRAWLTGQERRG